MKQFDTEKEKFQFSVPIFLLIKNLSTFFFTRWAFAILRRSQLCQKPSHFHSARSRSNIIKSYCNGSEKLKGTLEPLFLMSQRNITEDGKERQQNQNYFRTEAYDAFAFLI